MRYERLSVLPLPNRTGGFTASGFPVGDHTPD
jgi:hypothetical protein